MNEFQVVIRCFFTIADEVGIDLIISCEYEMHENFLNSSISHGSPGIELREGSSSEGELKVSDVRE
jgi:hypothetical protein